MNHDEPTHKIAEDVRGCHSHFNSRMKVLIFICFLSFSSAMKREEKPPDFLSTLRQKLNFPEADEDNEKSCQLNTLAINTLMLEENESEDLIVCCPESLIEWQGQHNMQSYHDSANCTVNVPETSTLGYEHYNYHQ